MRSMDIPLGAVIDAIAGLTGPALMQLNARTSEADPEVPEYLVSEDGEFIVDPASSDNRASLVVHMFEVSDEAQRRGAPAAASIESTESAPCLHGAGRSRRVGARRRSL